MNEFFKSELVRGDIQEMAELQQFCMRSMVAFPVLSPEKKMEYFNVMETLIEKQKIFYARLKLSDDPEAIEMAESMRDAIIMMGASPDANISAMFDDLLEKVKMMKEKLEAEGG
jgi:pentose-5-phosphate-3-epimerase